MLRVNDEFSHGLDKPARMFSVSIFQFPDFIGYFVLIKKKRVVFTEK